MSRAQATLVLADGTVFPGHAIGKQGEAVGEAVFTTSMTGYQEVLTDPSYCGQLVCMTAPQIGNTGTNPEDDEAGAPKLSGFIVHELSSVTSNWRCDRDLDAYLKAHNVVGIAGVDTRRLTRHIRDAGAQMGVIGSGDIEALKAKAKAAPGMSGRDLTGEVTSEAAHPWTGGTGWLPTPKREDAATSGHPPHVVAVDYGVKRNILRAFAALGCKVTVVPSTASAADVLAHKPDGIFLSNGPGDPSAVRGGIETVKALLGQRPVFGICLGHQLMALALGARTFKLKFGHRGINHPVKDLETGRVEITTQNHGFCVASDSLPEGTRVTHLHLNDDTVQGIACDAKNAFGVQYHPEASAGPHDSFYLFERFVSRLRPAS